MAWGDDVHGQCGTGDDAITFVTTPRTVGGLPPVTRISVGKSTSYALARDGAVWAWGHQGYGAVGDGGWTDAALPTRIAGYPVDAGQSFGAGGSSSNHAMVLQPDGTVFGCGRNDHGQMGNGEVLQNVMEATRLPLGSDNRDVARGLYHTILVRRGG